MSRHYSTTSCSTVLVGGGHIRVSITLWELEFFFFDRHGGTLPSVHPMIGERAICCQNQYSSRNPSGKRGEFPFPFRPSLHSHSLTLFFRRATGPPRRALDRVSRSCAKIYSIMPPPEWGVAGLSMPFGRPTEWHGESGNTPMRRFRHLSTFAFSPEVSPTSHRMPFL